MLIGRNVVVTVWRSGQSAHQCIEFVERHNPDHYVSAIRPDADVWRVTLEQYRDKYADGRRIDC